MSVQDPFVLDHNTTSNVNERFRCDIMREFRRASTQCHSLSACSDGISAEHAGIIELLSDSTSSVSSAVSSPQVVLSPQQTPDENAAGAKELAHMQLFVLRCRESVTSTTLVAPHPWHRVAELEHSVGEPECWADDGIGTISWCHNVTDVVKLMLSDIFDVECVSRDRPTAEFDSQLSQLLKVKRRNSSSMLGRQQVNNMADSQPHSAGPVDDRVTDDSELHPCRKHLLPVDGRDIDEDADGGSSSGETPVKRYKSDDSTSDVDVISGSAGSSRRLDLASTDRHVLLSAECSARSRLWVGRKKVRRQFMHFSDELKRQLEVSSALRSEVSASDHTIIEFELAVIGHQRHSADELLVAVLPSKKTSKEFGCFVMFFVSLLQKLVNTVTIEGPLVL